MLLQEEEEEDDGKHGEKHLLLHTSYIITQPIIFFMHSSP